MSADRFLRCELTDDEWQLVNDVVREVRNNMERGEPFFGPFAELLVEQFKAIEKLKTFSQPDLAASVLQSFVNLGAGFAVGVMLSRFSREESEEIAEGKKDERH